MILVTILYVVLLSSSMISMIVLVAQFKGDSQGKQKRIKVQKQRKWTRVSNTHLIGTELGSILKQKN